MTAPEDRDRYLWDGSGTPDPEVVRLERLLGTLRQRAPLPALPARRAAQSPHPWVSRSILPLAAAAVLTLVVTAAWFAISTGRRGWEVTNLEGAPRIGADPIGATGHLTVGARLVTDSSSRARIAVGDFGQVDVDYNTRLTLLKARVTESRLSLERGTIHASISAPPRFFIVNTPSAVAVDLGCAYTLEVDDEGAGLLRVTGGWVGFDFEGRESFIPEQAVCATRPGHGPGTPRYEDAPAPMTAALEQIDFGTLTSAGRSAAVDVVLQHSRKRDALTLWHLLTRTTGADREHVYDRMAALVPPPSGVTRAGILRGNRHMLDLWWAELGLNDTTWWRIWETPWPRIK